MLSACFAFEGPDEDRNAVVVDLGEHFEETAAFGEGVVGGEVCADHWSGARITVGFGVCI